MRRIALALFPLLVVACSSKVTGNVSSKGGDLGTFTVRPTKCESGQHWQYFGAAFFVDGDDGSKIEVVQDPLRGWFVKVAKPGTSTMEVFGKDNCKRLDADVHNTNTTINDIRVVEGSLKFTCTGEGESKVEGELTFSGCD